MNPIINTVYDDLQSNTQDLNYWVELEHEAPDFFNRIREEFSNQYKEAETQGTERSTVREAQKTVVDMINLLTNQLEQLNGTAPYKTKTISQYREKLNIQLRYIETYNKAFLDYEMPLSQFNYQSKMDHLLGKMLLIRNKYAHHNSELLTLLGKVLQSNISKTQRMSYGRYQLWVHIMYELEQNNLPSAESFSFDCDIRGILMRSNFNNQSFCTFYINQLKLDLEQHTTYAQKLMRLEWHLKYVKQQHSKKFMFYSYDNKKLLTMLKKHISGEIKYYNNLSNLKLKNGTKLPEVSEADHDYQQKNELQTNGQLRVPVNTFSYLVYQLWKKDYLKFNSKIHLAKVISYSFVRQDGEEINPDSISKKVLSLGIKEQQMLKKVLKDILDELD